MKKGELKGVLQEARGKFNTYVQQAITEYEKTIHNHENILKERGQYIERSGKVVIFQSEEQAVLWCQKILDSTVKSIYEESYRAVAEVVGEIEE